MRSGQHHGNGVRWQHLNNTPTNSAQDVELHAEHGASTTNSLMSLSGATNGAFASTGAVKAATIANAETFDQRDGHATAVSPIPNAHGDRRADRGGDQQHRNLQCRRTDVEQQRELDQQWKLHGQQRRRLFDCRPADQQQHPVGGERGIADRRRADQRRGRRDLNAGTITRTA
jgi:hypothetical protein